LKSDDNELDKFVGPFPLADSLQKVPFNQQQQVKLLFRIKGGEVGHGNQKKTSFAVVRYLLNKQRVYIRPGSTISFSHSQETNHQMTVVCCFVTTRHFVELLGLFDTKYLRVVSLNTVSSVTYATPVDEHVQQALDWWIGTAYVLISIVNPEKISITFPKSKPKLKHSMWGPFRSAAPSKPITRSARKSDPSDKQEEHNDEATEGEENNNKVKHTEESKKTTTRTRPRAQPQKAHDSLLNLRKDVEILKVANKLNLKKEKTMKGEVKEMQKQAKRRKRI
jgi:hypothetical protein